MNFINPREALKQSIKDVCVHLKYIHTEKGYYLCSLNGSHKHLFNESGSKVVISAGFLTLYFGKKVSINFSSVSESLESRPIEADLTGLAEYFGVPAFKLE